jgi:hypothetical protein
MLEALAFTLFKTYLAFLFGQQLRQQDTVLIEGAPKWYYQTVDDHVCRSSFGIGDLDAIETAKKNARYALVQHIDRGVKTVIYEHFSEVENPAERELIARFEKDAMLPRFVDSNLQYQNVEYLNEVNKGFARVCIQTNNLVKYQKNRLNNIRIAVLEKYRGEAFDELEAETPDTAPADIKLENNVPSQEHGPHQFPKQDPFQELERDTDIR